MADRGGVESLSMRRLAQELGVVPMTLYKHVANKDELLDGMLDVVVGEIDPPAPDVDWKMAIRRRILSARRALLHHPFATIGSSSRSRWTWCWTASRSSGTPPHRPLLGGPAERTDRS